MSKFRKKPVVVEAVQWIGSHNDENVAAIMAMRLVPTDSPFRFHGGTLQIQTLEGVMEAYPGDWIIRGVKGEFYPCKPDIFEATYEPVS